MSERQEPCQRLIDADELKGNAIADPDDGEHFVYCQDIEEAPTVDAVPVVRCRECKHLHMWDQKDRYAFCPKTSIVFSPFEKDIRTFFCSYGERKEE